MRTFVDADGTEYADFGYTVAEVAIVLGLADAQVKTEIKAGRLRTGGHGGKKSCVYQEELDVYRMARRSPLPEARRTPQLAGKVEPEGPGT